MKKCPVCNAVYNDNMLLKCTNCGNDLIEERQAYQTYTPPQNNYNNYQNGYNAYNSQFKICPNCGNHCDPRAVICVKCGVQFADMYKAPAMDDKPSRLLKVLCFFVPVLGLILYLVNMNSKPVSAKAYGKMGLIGFIIGIVLYVGIIVFGILFSFLGLGLSSPPNIQVYPESDFFYSF